METPLFHPLRFHLTFDPHLWYNTKNSHLTSQPNHDTIPKKQQKTNTTLRKQKTKNQKTNKNPNQKHTKRKTNTTLRKQTTKNHPPKKHSKNKKPTPH